MINKAQNSSRSNNEKGQLRESNPQNETLDSQELVNLRENNDALESLLFALNTPGGEKALKGTITSELESHKK
ncbi:hypothetical protein HYV31_02210 [candidate division WWE3 bacterium]|nr:hypothetical protein [candidate division WWE3 bacterium]